MLPLRARMDIGAMKGYSAFSKAPALLEPCHQIVKCHIQDTRWGGGSYHSAEKQSVYSTAPANLGNYFLCDFLQAKILYSCLENKI